MSNKCHFYDKGYCKNKTNCSQGHPPLDCDGQCEDKISCPKRHRVHCKNGSTCIYIPSNSCEFLHPRNGQHEVRELNIEELKTSKQAIDTKLINIEARLAELDNAQLESKIRTVESRLVNQIKDLELRLNESNTEVAKAHELLNVIIDTNELEAIIPDKKSNNDESKSTQESLHDGWSNFDPDDSATWTGPDLIDCEICGAPAPESEMEEHVTTMHIKCKHCNYTSMASDLFENHKCDANKPKQILTDKSGHFKCGKCPMKLITKELLEEHLVTIHTCNVCKKVYKTPSTLKNHYINMHKDSPECGKCVKRFLTKYDLENHIENDHVRSLDRESSTRTKPKKSQKVKK